MATTVTQLLIEYPDLSPINEENHPYVVAVLARAERLSGNAWPAAYRDDAVYLQTAEWLALSPAGRNAKLSVELTSGRFTTSYTDALKALKKAAFAAVDRVV